MQSQYNHLEQIAILDKEQQNIDDFTIENSSKTSTDDYISNLFGSNPYSVIPSNQSLALIPSLEYIKVKKTILEQVISLILAIVTNISQYIVLTTICIIILFILVNLTFFRSQSVDLIKLVKLDILVFSIFDFCKVVGFEVKSFLIK
jgi:hypothetical protein